MQTKSVNQISSKSVKQLNRKNDPTVQLYVLKKIAMKGFQSKKSLESDNYWESVTEMAVDKLKEKYGLIQICYKKRVGKAKKPQTHYSLTEKGIEFLVEDHDKKGKPYLNLIELEYFLKRYDDDYQKQQENKVVEDWAKPSLDTKKIQTLYVKSNPIIYGKIKPNSKIKKLAEHAGKLRKKLASLEEEAMIALFEIKNYEIKSKKKKK